MRKPIGGFKVVYEYAHRLTERGHRVNVIHPLLLYPEKKNVTQKLGMFGRWTASSVFGIPRLSWFHISPKVNTLVVPNLEERYIPKANVIVATAWQTAEWVNKYDQDKGEKFYFIQHYENWSGQEERVKATWKMPLKKIVIARWLAEKAKEMGEEVVAHIPNGLNLQQFHISRAIEERDPKRIGMVYHKLKWKGSKDGIKALTLVRKKFPDLQAVFFSIYSPGPDVPHWVEFYKNPPQDKISEIYNSCSIFVGSSWYEGWFLPGAEAMACGCAVVSTDCGGIREYALHEKTALLSEPKDPEKIAQNIIRLICDSNLRLFLAESGYKFVQNFTWKKAVDEFEKVLLNQK